MATDIFEFWSRMRLEDGPPFVHPADREVLSRVEHGFDLDCLPRSFTGPLRTAPVVLLFLRHRLSEQHRTDVKTEAGRARYGRQWGGKAPLWGPEDNEAGWRWWTSYTRCFGDWRNLQTKVAILNICAYHCKPPFRHRRLLKKLPSSLVSVDWAQSVLFPEAEAGTRVVVCMMSHQFWGLQEREQPYGRALFTPPVVRGRMRHGQTRDAVIREVKAALAR